uniref:Uncharacterized protein n=1 Tax=Physcomitrium patens TaxID=3218 RepID=A0A2K1JEA4_PHYPA|nr:hypothetical protein PHYPA_020124 [Physcomitrium patens]
MNRGVHPRNGNIVFLLQPQISRKLLKKRDKFITNCKSHIRRHRNPVSDTTDYVQTRQTIYRGRYSWVVIGPLLQVYQVITQHRSLPSRASVRNGTIFSQVTIHG